MFLLSCYHFPNSWKKPKGEGEKWASSNFLWFHQFTGQTTKMLFLIYLSKSIANINHLKSMSELGSKALSLCWAADTSFELLSDVCDKQSFLPFLLK